MHAAAGHMAGLGMRPVSGSGRSVLLRRRSLIISTCLLPVLALHMRVCLPVSGMQYAHPRTSQMRYNLGVTPVLYTYRLLASGPSVDSQDSMQREPVRIHL